MMPPPPPLMKFCSFLWNTGGGTAVCRLHVAIQSNAPVSPSVWTPPSNHDIATTLTVGHSWVQISDNRRSKLLEPLQLHRIQSAG